MGTWAEGARHGRTRRPRDVALRALGRGWVAYVGGGGGRRAGCAPFSHMSFTACAQCETIWTREMAAWLVCLIFMSCVTTQLGNGLNPEGGPIDGQTLGFDICSQGKAYHGGHRLPGRIAFNWREHSACGRPCAARTGWWPDGAGYGRGIRGYPVRVDGLVRKLLSGRIVVFIQLYDDV